MMDAFSKAVGQLSDPKIRRIVVQVLGLALGVLIALIALCWIGAAYAPEEIIPWDESWAAGDDPIAWLMTLAGWIVTALNWAISALLVALPILLAWLLFPIVVSALMGLFLDPVAAAVERKHYPDLPPARDQPFGEMVGDGLRFAAIAIGLNVLALPFYLFLPGLNLIIYYLLNGYLLGREYTEMVAIRRMTATEARDYRRQNAGRAFASGAGFAFLMTIPVINLIAPVLAVATTTHLVHGDRQR